MYIKYGSFQHEDNDTSIVVSKRRIRDRRGRHSITRHRYVVRGELLASTQATIKTKIAALENAYSIDGRDFGLYHDDGTVSGHFLDSSQAIGGTRVVSLTYPEGEGAEYATTRTYQIELEGDVLHDGGLELFEETVDIRGDGGPRTVLIETLSGPPVLQQTNARTIVRATQSGMAIGRAGLVSPPTPLWPRPIYKPEQSSMSRRSPQRFNNEFLNYTVRWNYVFESPVPLSGRPNER